ncbi:TetR/AcrR family transcriptional regulator [Nocardioides marinquilinus]|uniref:TetR/AcrR family transcriptional regulator n=1 Tax=Nocardioides marinquilinus TaxID=1210400 RepID=UPI0031E5D983
MRTPRESWVEAGLSALAAGGPDAVRIEALAGSLRVTKGGFYWHFRDRRALLDAMLDHWEATLVDRTIEAADHGGGEGRARLRRLFRAADADGLLGLEVAVRDWARRDPAVAERVARVDDRRTAYLRPLFAEFCAGPADVEGRCLLVLTLFVGESLVAATHGRRTRPAVTAAALRHLLA